LARSLQRAVGDGAGFLISAAHPRVPGREGVVRGSGAPVVCGWEGVRRQVRSAQIVVGRRSERSTRATRPSRVARRDDSASTRGQPDNPTVTHKGRPEGRPTPPPQQPRSGTAPPVRCAGSGRRPTRQDGDHRNHPEATNREDTRGRARQRLRREPEQSPPLRGRRSRLTRQGQPALTRGQHPRPRRPPHTHAMRGGPHPWAAREPRSVPSERGTKGFTPRPPKRGDPHAPRGHRHPKRGQQGHHRRGTRPVEPATPPGGGEWWWSAGVGWGLFAGVSGGEGG